MFRTYSRLILFLCGFFISDCTPMTGSRVVTSRTDIAKIKTIGITVKKDENFSVRLSREEFSATGLVAGQILLGLPGALLGTGIEAARRNSADLAIEEQFKPLLGNYDPQKEMGQKMLHHLQPTKQFTEVVIIDAQDDSSPRGRELDSLVEVTLREWGLRRCVGPEQNVQIGLNINGKLLLKSGSTIWERDELYLDGTCRPWGDFLSHEGLLKGALANAIENLSGKIANEILFP